MQLLLYILLTPALLYFALLLFVNRRLGKNDQFSSEGSVINNHVSIVIPARNEAGNISACLKAIRELNKEGIEYEVIVADDHSDDETSVIAETFKDKLPLSTVHSEATGKKAALLAGIHVAQYPLIITLDADSTVKRQWLQCMLKEFGQSGLQMLCGPVSISSKGNISDIMQQGESAAIVGLSHSMLNAGYPCTCNGANLMFKKQAFLDMDGYGIHAGLASGDDDLLMHRFFSLYKDKVRYTLNPEACVSTSAVSGMRNLMHQRQRWLSKRQAYLYPYNNFIQMLVVLHLISFYTALLMLVYTGDIVFALPVLIKYAADLIYGWHLKQFLKFKWFAIFIMPFYLLYIPVLLMISPFRTVLWKGRTL